MVIPKLRMTRRARIASLATYVPPRVLTNADLERMVETSDEWILQRTGIRERHIVDPGVATSDLAAEAAREAIARAGLTPDDIDLFVSHQANMRIIKAAGDRLGFPECKVMINLQRYGNTTAATIPLAITDAVAEGRIKKGSLVLLASVGAGFTVGSVLVRWAY